MRHVAPTASAHTSMSTATEVIQSLDTKAKAGHAGSTAGNEHSIAFEITGMTTWTRQKWLASVCWPLLSRVIAILCHEYGIQPRHATVAQMRANPRVLAFYDHDDMRQAWGSTTHTDPGPNFPWDHLLSLVRAELEDTMTPDQFLALLGDQRVQALLRALPWQYPVTPQLSMLNALAGPTGLFAQTAQLSGQVAGLMNLVQELAARPSSPVTPEQLAQLIAAIEAASRAGAAELSDRLAFAARAEADALDPAPDETTP